MIVTREDLYEYLEADKRALKINLSRPRLFKDRIWKYERLLRFTEYYTNNINKSIFHRLLAYYYKYRWRKECFKLGNEIPLNVIGKGLVIWHGRNIIINKKAKIGENFGISAGCVVGQAHGLVPVIGNNVSLTIGSKVLGGISICDNVTVGASSLVLKSITEEYVTVGGIPAKILSRKDPNKGPIIRG